MIHRTGIGGHGRLLQPVAFCQAAEGREGGGDLRAGGKVEVAAEEHQDEAEPDGRRGHRPVVSDRHRRRSEQPRLRSRQ